MKLFFTLGLVVLLASCGGNEKGNKGDKKPIDTNDVQYQINKLTEAIAASPKDYLNYYHRALIYYQNGNTQLAISDVENSIKNFETWPDSYHLRGFLSYVQNEDSIALIYFKRAAELGSENPETYYHIGQIYFFDHNYAEAEKYYNTASGLDSLQPIYPFAKGYMYESQKKYDQAIKFYEEARAIDPGFIKALWRLHIMYKEVKHDMGKALAYNDMILQVDSMHPIGTFNQGLFNLESALNITDTAHSEAFRVLLKQAVIQFSKTLRVDPKFKNASFNRGYCFLLMGRYDDALSDLNAAVESDPYNDKAFFLKGSIHENQGDLQSALSSYEQALALNPGFREAAVGVKELKGKLGAGKGR